jgi:hypothetical protein
VRWALPRMVKSRTNFCRNGVEDVVDSGVVVELIIARSSDRAFHSNGNSFL